MRSGYGRNCKSNLPSKSIYCLALTHNPGQGMVSPSRIENVSILPHARLSRANFNVRATPTVSRSSFFSTAFHKGVGVLEHNAHTFRKIVYLKRGKVMKMMICMIDRG